jgi:hypothetical protein
LAHWHRRTPVFFSCMSRCITILTSERLPFSTSSFPARSVRFCECSTGRWDEVRAAVSIE